ncbi:hypothetical protein EG329_014391 [Mollisiaceae sp. DMI_Dod_QoI]|nr:hypothetical protein EG329_014391 [Helotiales sp. DMI_Dod_QoI]
MSSSTSNIFSINIMNPNDSLAKVISDIDQKIQGLGGLPVCCPGCLGNLYATDFENRLQKAKSNYEELSEGWLRKHKENKIRKELKELMDVLDKQLKIHRHAEA